MKIESFLPSKKPFIGNSQRDNLSKYTLERKRMKSSENVKTAGLGKHGFEVGRDEDRSIHRNLMTRDTQWDFHSWLLQTSNNGDYYKQ